MARVKQGTFDASFRPDCGDLIYGCSQGGTDWRQRYVEHLPLTVRSALTPDVYYTIDQYNNNLGLFSPDDHFLAMDTRVQAGELGEKNEPITAPQAAYYSSIRTSPFDPRQVFHPHGEMAVKLKKEGYAELAETAVIPDQRLATQYAQMYKMVRMACKFGIAHFARLYHAGVHDAVIHFVLDGLNLTDVVNKVKVVGHMGRTAVPITYSELRSCYRNWDEYRDCVWFYRNFLSVPAPWEERGGSWADYAEARRAKHERLVRQVRAAISEYNKYPLFHWKSDNSKVIRGILERLLRDNVRYEVLKSYVKWFLGYSASPPAEPVVTHLKLEPKRFRSILDRRYLAWCNGA